MASTTAQDRLTGLRILLVEDNFLIATYLKRLLTTWGVDVVGPAPSVDEASQLAEDHRLSGAILDVNIVGGNSVPVAAKLQARGLPFFFITGYGSPLGLPETMSHRPRLNKPIDERKLQTTIRNEFALT
jgi:DNA-binding NtrC family response regulator